jgi:hypothetical protein
VLGVGGNALNGVAGPPGWLPGAAGLDALLDMIYKLGCLINQKKRGKVFRNWEMTGKFLA